MLKAFYDVVGRENIRNVSAQFSLSNALFCRAWGAFDLNAGLLAEVEQRMRELAEQALPIEKRSVDIEDAIAFLKANGMEDKARILKYRISSRVNLYTLDGFTDYFYGYMVPDTGYLKWFALEPFEDGFILRLPALENPEQVGGVHPFHEGVPGYARRRGAYRLHGHLQRRRDGRHCGLRQRHPADPCP